MPIYAICPFFLSERKNIIYCELGTMRFPTHKHKRTLSTRFCESFDYEKCKRAQRLMEQYEEEERMQYKRKQLRGMAPHVTKYHSQKVEIDGITFDSRKEARRYSELKLLEKAGKIENLRMQERFVLIPSQYETVETGEYYQVGSKKGIPKTKEVCVEKAVVYVADFVYRENGKTVVEDTKGFKTKDYIIKRKLMLKEYGIRVKEV